MDEFEFVLASQNEAFESAPDWAANYKCTSLDWPAVAAMNAALYPVWNEIMTARRDAELAALNDPESKIVVKL